MRSICPQSKRNIPKCLKKPKDVQDYFMAKNIFDDEVRMLTKFGDGETTTKILDWGQSSEYFLIMLNWYPGGDVSKSINGKFFLFLFVSNFIKSEKKKFFFTQTKVFFSKLFVELEFLGWLQRKNCSKCDQTNFGSNSANAQSWDCTLVCFIVPKKNV